MKKLTMACILTATADPATEVFEFTNTYDAKGEIPLSGTKTIEGRKMTEKAGRTGSFIALMLFVGIPVPGTGAWTGTLAASILELGIKTTTVAVALGVFIAGLIMMAASTVGFSLIG